MPCDTKSANAPCFVRCSHVHNSFPFPLFSKITKFNESLSLNSSHSSPKTQSTLNDKNRRLRCHIMKHNFENAHALLDNLKETILREARRKKI